MSKFNYDTDTWDVIRTYFDDNRELVKHHLDSVKAPKMVHITDDLPRSAVGKILRRAAKDLFG